MFFLYSPLISDKKLPKQGWKIHISTNYDNYRKILEIVLKYCDSNRIYYKYIKEKYIYKVLYKKASRLSSGKIITLYPVNDMEFLNCLQDLYQLLVGERGPRILTDMRYKDSKVLHYRYGVIANLDKTIIYPDGKTIKETLLPYYNLPDFVDDEFINNEIKETKSYFFKYYYINKSIKFSNYGGVYEGIKKDNQQEVIIKEYRFGTGESINISSIDIGNNEMKQLSLLKGEQVPKIIESFFEDDNLYLVLEKVGDKTLRLLKEDVSPMLVPSWNISEITKRIDNLYILAKNIVCSIKAVHQKGCVHNDISLDNILVNDHNEIKLIDFEISYLVGESKKLNIINSVYKDKKGEIIVIKDPQKQELREVGYMLIDFCCNATKLLSVDPSGKMTQRIFEDFCITYQSKKFYSFVSKLLGWDYPRKRKKLRYNYLFTEIDREIKDIDDYVSKCKKNELKNIIKEKHKNIKIMNSLEQEFQRIISQINESNANNLPVKIIKSDILIIKEIMNSAIKTDEHKLVIKVEKFIILFLKSVLRTDRKLIIDENEFYNPYLNGTAGVIKETIYWINNYPNEEISDLCEELLKYIDFNYAGYSGYSMGLAGIMNTQLEAFDFYQDNKLLESIILKFHSIRLFKNQNSNDWLYPYLCYEEVDELTKMKDVFLRLSKTIKNQYSF